MKIQTMMTSSLKYDLHPICYNTGSRWEAGEVVGSPRLLTEENYHNITIYYTEKQNRIIICNNMYYSCKPICFSIDQLEIYKTHSTIYFIHNIIKYCAVGTHIIKYDFFRTGLTSREQHYINIWIVYNKIRIWKQLCLEIRSADYATTTVRRIYSSAHPHTYTPTHPHGKTIIYTYISYTVH